MSLQVKRWRENRWVPAQEAEFAVKVEQPKVMPPRPRWRWGRIALAVVIILVIAAIPLLYAMSGVLGKLAMAAESLDKKMDGLAPMLAGTIYQNELTARIDENTVALRLAMEDMEKDLGSMLSSTQGMNSTLKVMGSRLGAMYQNTNQVGSRMELTKGLLGAMVAGNGRLVTMTEALNSDLLKSGRMMRAIGEGLKQVAWTSAQLQQLTVALSALMDDANRQVEVLSNQVEVMARKSEEMNNKFPNMNIMPRNFEIALKQMEGNLRGLHSTVQTINSLLSKMADGIGS